MSIGMTKKSKLRTIFLINILVFIGLIVSLEAASAFGRYMLGKGILPMLTKGVLEYSPCVRVKTHVLLSHVSDHRGECEPLDGQVEEQFVFYNKNKKTNKIIVTLGGSSTSGFYQHFSEGHTWPLALQKQLDPEIYGVVNGGLGGYTSLQEMYKLISEVPRIEGPVTAVVSFNGLNELPDYQGVDEIRKVEYPFLSDTQYRIN